MAGGRLAEAGHGRSVEGVCIFTVSAYETLALLTPLPTITSLVHRLPRPVRGLLVGFIVVWLVDHMEVV